MTTTIYGIKNCDTMKKARAWLDARGVPYAFHDYKASGIEAATLKGWAGQVGWEKLLNRAGTTFRKLPDADREGDRRGKGDRADGRAALDDQAARAGGGEEAAGRLLARNICQGIRLSLGPAARPALARTGAKDETGPD
jgi:hypothetical protein